MFTGPPSTLIACFWVMWSVWNDVKHGLREQIQAAIFALYVIRRPRPSPRQGRHLGPPQVRNLFFPFASRQMPESGHNSAVKAAQATAFCFQRVFKRAVCPASKLNVSFHEPLGPQLAVCQAFANPSQQLRPPLPPQHSVSKGRSSLPLARLQNPQNVSPRHSGHSLPLDRLLTLRGSSHEPLRPQHSVFQAAQATAFCF